MVVRGFTDIDDVHKRAFPSALQAQNCYFHFCHNIRKMEGKVDFIKINYPWGGSWPTFNVADVLVFVGVALFVAYALWRRPEDPGQSPSDDTAEERAS